MTSHLQSLRCRRVEEPVHDAYMPPAVRAVRRVLATVPKYSVAAFGKELVRVVVGSNWSFRTIERPAFRRFVQFLRPDNVPVTRFQFKTIFEDQYSIITESLLDNLGKNTRVSIALDAWSSGNHLSFLAIKGYYIDENWKLREPLLDFVPLRGSHTGMSIALEVTQVLQKLDLLKRLLALTADNASNNRTMASHLQFKLEALGVEWDCHENSIPCLAHIVDLVVQAIIRHLKLASSDSIEAAESLQRRHMGEISASTSVPNSLKKVRRVITQGYHRLGC
jgi:hypothetical protein